MSKGRLEAFSDGVLAIIITIMVLEFRVPEKADFAALREIQSVFLAYLLSFVILGIYWNNHHHMLQMTARINGRVLWANLHLLFWLSLVPFGTAWMEESHFAPVPTATYGVVLIGAAAAYTILQALIVACNGPQSQLAEAIGRDVKGKLSGALYAVAIPLAFLHPAIAIAIYVSVALIWLAPDPRIESRLGR